MFWVSWDNLSFLSLSWVLKVYSSLFPFNYVSVLRTESLAFRATHIHTVDCTQRGGWESWERLRLPSQNSTNSWVLVRGHCSVSCHQCYMKNSSTVCFMSIRLQTKNVLCFKERFKKAISRPKLNVFMFNNLTIQSYCSKLILYLRSNVHLSLENYIIIATVKGCKLFVGLHYTKYYGLHFYLISYK